MLGGGELGLDVELGGKVGRGGLGGGVAAALSLGRTIRPIRGRAQDFAQEAGARLVGERGLGQLPRLLSRRPLGPQHVEACLLGGEFGRALVAGRLQQPGEVVARRDVEGGVGVGSGDRLIESEIHLRVGQQARGEHLGRLDAERGPFGLQVGIVQHGQHRDLQWREPLAGVDGDGLQRRQPQPLDIGLQEADVAADVGPARQWIRLVGLAGCQRRERRQRQPSGDATASRNASPSRQRALDACARQSAN